MVDQRKTRRSQVFYSHRLRHFFASDDHIRQKFNTICQHLDLVGGGCCNYTDEQKLTVLLLIMVGGDMPQIADFIRYELANELMRHINNELNALISGICSIVAEINNDDDNHHHHHHQHHYDDDVNYHHIDAKQSIGARFENDNLTFRLNINSISDLMIELLSLLLQSFGHRCQTRKRAITITINLLRIFELCYKQMGHSNYLMIEHNLNAAIVALTATNGGAGRLDRTKFMVEYKPLMECLFNQMTRNFGAGNNHESSTASLALQILNNLANGFPENIELLIRYNLLGHLRNHLIDTNCHIPTQQHATIVEQCLSILDNICGNHRSDIQAVIDANLIAPIVNGMKNEMENLGIQVYTRLTKVPRSNYLCYTSLSRRVLTQTLNLLIKEKLFLFTVFKPGYIYIGLRKLALNIFVSISTLGNTQQIKALLDTDLMPLLCGQLHNRESCNDTIIEVSALFLHIVYFEWSSI